MVKKKLRVWLPLLLSLCVVAGMFVGYRIRSDMPNRGIFYIQKPKPVQEVLELIQKKYVDTVNADSLGGVAIQSMLAGLDPHSVYIPPLRLKDINEDLQGVFYGIGIEFMMLKDTMHVTNTVKEGPSEKVGLRSGDEIIRVDDSLVAGNQTSNQTFKNLLKGNANTKVQVSFLREGKDSSVTITRGPIPILSVDASYMISDTIGYLRINKFSETTYKEFMEAMHRLKEKGMKALIFDLRDNGGGILTEATHIADEFLSGTKLITYTQGAHSPRKDYTCDKEGIFENGPVVVLANEGTASASEVIIGAFQDWDRATIVGRRTFGKGLVQEQYQLNDGSGLRLTVARYYTPLGRSIQKSYQNGSEAYRMDIINRFKHGEMEHQDSIKHLNQKKFVNSSGKTLYGGGGISPDIFVSVDTALFHKSLMHALMEGTLNRFVYYNYLQHKKKLDAYSSPQDFLKNYTVSKNVLNHFKKFAQTDSIEVQLSNPEIKEQFASQLKMLTARQLWQSEGFYVVKNANDANVQAALKVLRERDKKQKDTRGE